jgi:hypothetical protein
LQLIVELQFAQNSPQVLVGAERDVVMAVPGDIAELPGVGQTADVVGRFKQRDAKSSLGQAQGDTLSPASNLPTSSSPSTLAAGAHGAPITARNSRP